MKRITKRKTLHNKEINIVEGNYCFDLWKDFFVIWTEPKEFVGQAVDKLAAYEDIGLEPEEINELLHQSYGPLHEKLGEWIQAEKDGTEKGET